MATGADVSELEARPGWSSLEHHARGQAACQRLEFGASEMRKTEVFYQFGLLNPSLPISTLYPSVV